MKCILADDESIDKNCHRELAVAKQIGCPIYSNFPICSFNLSLNVQPNDLHLMIYSVEQNDYLFDLETTFQHIFHSRIMLPIMFVYSFFFHSLL